MNAIGNWQREEYKIINDALLMPALQLSILLSGIYADTDLA